MRLAVAKEVRVGECRVALVPSAVTRLVERGFEVWVEAGAGNSASITDDRYLDAGAKVVPDAAEVWGGADVLLKVSPPTERQGQHEVDRLQPGAVLIGFLNPLAEPALVQRLAKRQITAFGMELIPRLSRAQSMDALSSQAAVAGYKAALLAADAVGKFFPMLTTAAGTIAPAKVFVLGAGVAGLMAIATARRLGAVVEAFDIRPSTREEVQSLGATFVGVELSEETVAAGGYAQEVSESAQAREQAILGEHVQRADVVITTAAVPGKRAPQLVTEAMVAAMQPGAVIVDLAAEQGGNCACTVPGEDVVRHGIKILGLRNVPSLMPLPASEMYAKNIGAFLQLLIQDDGLHLDLTDEILRGACVTHAGEVVHEQVQAVMQSDVRNG